MYCSTSRPPSEWCATGRPLLQGKTANQPTNQTKKSKPYLVMSADRHGVSTATTATSTERAMSPWVPWWKQAPHSYAFASLELNGVNLELILPDPAFILNLSLFNFPSAVLRVNRTRKKDKWYWFYLGMERSILTFMVLKEPAHVGKRQIASHWERLRCPHLL